jgi:predicted DNA-binding transcriptional regulator AlpA
MSQHDEYLDVTQTAKRLGVSASFLNKARVTGDGPPYAKFAKAVRYDWAAVKEWAVKQTRHSTSEYEVA